MVMKWQNSPGSERDKARAKSATDRSVELASARAHKAEVAKMPDAPCPMQMLLAEALSGSKHAQWRAEKIYGNAWRKIARKQVQA